MKNQEDSIDYCKQIAEGTTMHTAEGTSCHVTHEGTFSSHFYVLLDISLMPQLSNESPVYQITIMNCFIEFDDWDWSSA